MSNYHDWDSIQAVTPTLCRLLGVAQPALCNESPLTSVLEAAQATLGTASVQKVLIFAPDALGKRFLEQQPTLHDGIVRYAPLAVSLRSVVPAKTPVCFASMFTGAKPAQHGITKYEKPVLRCDTFFDALLRAGKRVAIVAVTGCSMDRIFRERAMDYFSELYDPQVTQRALALLAADRHDVIVAYHQGYDDALHKTTPWSASAMQAAQASVSALADLARAFARDWSPYRRVLLVAPDHGAHVDPATGTGGHGEDILEDMELWHFYAVGAAGMPRHAEQ